MQVVHTHAIKYKHDLQEHARPQQLDSVFPTKLTLCNKYRSWLFLRIDPEKRKFSASKIRVHAAMLDWRRQARATGQLPI